MKRCPKCGQEKSVDEFCNDSQRPDGKATYCRQCKRQVSKESYEARMLRDPEGQRAKTRRSLAAFRARNAESIREQQKRWYENGGREWTHEYQKQRFYGITVAQYEQMLAAQGGVCAVCGQPERRRNPVGEIRRLAVDHDHVTGVVRGLLCADCNQVLGYAEDDPRRLRAAAEYLERMRHDCAQ